jgi:hypothetical protein
VAQWGRAVTAAYVTAGLDQGWADLYHDIATRPTTQEPPGPGGASAAHTPAGQNGHAPNAPRADPAATLKAWADRQVIASGSVTSGLPDRGLRPVPGTRLVPKGLPKRFRIREADNEGGIVYFDPKNKGNAIRVMPGNPLSRFTNSRVPYVRWQRNGHPLDVDGNILPTKKCPEAHISVSQIKLLPEVYK